MVYQIFHTCAMQYDSYISCSLCKVCTAMQCKKCDFKPEVSIVGFLLSRDFSNFQVPGLFGPGSFRIFRSRKARTRDLEPHALGQERGARKSPEPSRKVPVLFGPGTFSVSRSCSVSSRSGTFTFQGRYSPAGFSLHFPKQLSYGYLTFEGNGKIPLGR